MTTKKQPEPKPKTRRRRRKGSARKKNHYFTQVHEDAIIRYTATNCIQERTHLYVTYIQPALGEMVDKIVFTYKFTNLPNIDYLRDECKIWLMTILDKYNPSGVVFLTGDKHFSSIFKRFGHLEFMSSGLSHTVEGLLVRSYVSRFYPNSFFGLNYGHVEIDWDSKPLAITLSVKSFYPEPIFKYRYILNPLNQWELAQTK